MDDLLSEFLVETGEQLDELDTSLVHFEQNPNDAEMLNTIFRVAHTIKGTCGFFDLPRLAKLAHAAEALMGRYRDGAPVSAQGVTVILASLERFKEILADIERDGREPQGSDDDLIQRLETLAEEQTSTEEETSAKEDISAEEQETSPGAPDADHGVQFQTPAEIEGEMAPATSPVHDHLDALERAWQEAPASPASPETVEPDAPVVTQDAFSSVDPNTDQLEVAPADAPPQTPLHRVQTVRVAVDTLETLMTTVSELVLARNQLLDLATRSDVPAFSAPLQRLSAVTVELQDTIMKARLQPIANAWQKLPVLVRTLATELGKSIEITMSGGDKELDRQVLEAIKDPLTHMVRNAADHGLEDPRGRAVAGKPATGRIRLRASQQGGSIVVEVSDDGRGLDVQAVRRKALAKGLASPMELDALSDAEICNFIFNPGFSTTDTVSEISGRGVSMDVVRSNIESIGGAVELASTSSRGTTFVIRIPLTLAIMSALIVDAAGMRFAIPQFSIVELARTGETAGHPVETINGAAVLHLRDEMLPLLDFGAQLGLREADWHDVNASGRTAVIMQAGSKRFGIVVDAASRTEEIVVKPVSSLLRQIDVFSGSTILGDGSVIMIVDPAALAGAVGHIDGLDEGAAYAEPVARDDNRMALLLFRAGSQGLKALPLSLVTRLEDVLADSIEVCDDQDVVQYRGGLLPLVRLSDDRSTSFGATLPVVVFTEGTRAAGLVVDEIVDIVEEPLAIDLHGEGTGIAGVAIVRDQAVEIVDVGHYLAPFFDHPDARDGRGAAGPTRILLVDDGQFFRDMLAPLLRGSGYDVTPVSSAREALALKDAGEHFDIVVTDIEMPGMDGLALARAIRADSEWSTVPLIGLSSQPSPRLAEAGRLAGFDAFVGKFDRRSLMQVLGSWQEDREDAA